MIMNKLSYIGVCLSLTVIVIKERDRGKGRLLCVCVCACASLIVPVPEQWLSLERQASWQEAPVTSNPQNLTAVIPDRYTRHGYLCLSEQYYR